MYISQYKRLMRFIHLSTYRHSPFLSDSPACLTTASTTATSTNCCQVSFLVLHTLPFIILLSCGRFIFMFFDFTVLKYKPSAKHELWHDLASVLLCVCSEWTQFCAGLHGNDQWMGLSGLWTHHLYKPKLQYWIHLIMSWFYYLWIINTVSPLWSVTD